MRRGFGRRLDARQRGKSVSPRRPGAAPSSPQEILYKRGVPRSQAAQHTPSLGVVKALEEVLEGCEVTAPSGGKAYQVQAEDHVINARAASACARLPELLADPESGPAQQVALVVEDPIGPEDILFLDIETAGLGTAPVFQIGVMVWRQVDDAEGCFVVRQFLARTYAEERAIIELFIAECEGKKMLVSFNGKSFDWPFLRTRSAAVRIDFPENMPHLDLLHASRRVWKDTLPNCKLQTLELHICGRGRVGDIPGEEIPDTYHAYVRTSNAIHMGSILEHNALDLLTLADILTHLPAPKPK